MIPTLISINKTSPYNYNDNYASNEYNDYSDKENNNKYECQKGPFEGFFVSSPEFCVQKEPPKEKHPQERTFNTKRNPYCCEKY